jgi:ATP-dependent Clp protease ATP-binding subunit ClpX
MVPAGIVGVQVEGILSELFSQALNQLLVEGKDNDDDLLLQDAMRLARRGIIFFDELDKLAVDSKNQSAFSGAGEFVQRRLLKLADGATFPVTVQGEASLIGNLSRQVMFDTSGLLLIGGGAFVGIDSSSMRSRRPQELSRLLAKSNPNVVVSADVVNYGFLHELVARFPIIIELASLTREQLGEILNNDEISPFTIWRSHFESLGKRLVLSEDAREFVLDVADALKLGARGLHQVLFPGMADVAFELEQRADQDIVISREMLQASRLRSPLS